MWPHGTRQRETFNTAAHPQETPRARYTEQRGFISRRGRERVYRSSSHVIRARENIWDPKPLQEQHKSMIMWALILVLSSAECFLMGLPRMSLLWLLAISLKLLWSLCCSAKGWGHHQFGIHAVTPYMGTHTSQRNLGLFQPGALFQPGPA